MSACKINIGHNRDHVKKGPLTDEQVRRVVLNEVTVWPVGVTAIVHHDTQYGDTTERVTVTGLTCDDEQTLRNFIEELSGLLEQECISTVWGPVWAPPYRGEFVGPEADKWQTTCPWDPDYFVDHDGLPLTAKR